MCHKNYITKNVNSLRCFTWVVENAGIVIDFLGGSDHPLQKQWEDLGQGSLITEHCGSDICDPSN